MNTRKFQIFFVAINALLAAVGVIYFQSCGMDDRSSSNSQAASPPESDSSAMSTNAAALVGTWTSGCLTGSEQTNESATMLKFVYESNGVATKTEINYSSKDCTSGTESRTRTLTGNLLLGDAASGPTSVAGSTAMDFQISKGTVVIQDAEQAAALTGILLCGQPIVKDQLVETTVEACGEKSGFGLGSGDIWFDIVGVDGDSLRFGDISKKNSLGIRPSLRPTSLSTISLKKS